jgi:hypothetical protein
MNFRQVTDALLKAVTLEDLADAIGVSVQTIRQARAAEGTSAHRSPPPKWEAGAALLARKAAIRYRKIAQSVARKNQKGHLS